MPFNYEFWMNDEWSYCDVYDHTVIEYYLLITTLIPGTTLHPIKKLPFGSF